MGQLSAPTPLPGHARLVAALALAWNALAAATRSLRDGGAIRSYSHLLGGSVARLLLSLFYFVALTTALGLAEFGFFATSAAVGIVLSRLCAFGYSANMFVVSATRPRLLGPYLANLFVWIAASLPLCLAAALAIYWLFFPRDGKLVPYLVIVGVEVVIWRLIDVVAVVNSGLGRFGRSAATYNVGFLARTVAALLLLGFGGGIGTWAIAYALANTAALVAAWIWLMPRLRLRLRRGSLLLRGRAGMAIGSAHLFSMGQGECDKVLVLALGGELAAGIFATCTRLIDISAMPVRAFNIMMIRKVLRDPGAMRGARGLILTELGIALISTLAFGGIALALWLRPDILGAEIAKAAPVLPLLFCLPAFRNLIEYQAELLYARQRQTALLLISLTLILLKAAVMTLIFWHLAGSVHWAIAMNVVFLAAYLTSTIGVYGLERGPAREGTS